MIRYIHRIFHGERQRCAAGKGHFLCPSHTLTVQVNRMKKTLVKSSLCLLLVFALCFGDVASMLPPTKVSAAATATAVSETPSPAVQTQPEQSEGVVRPEDIDEGLSLNSLDDIRGRRVTVRQPVMEILEDNIVRKLPDVLPNEYQMLDLASGSELHPLAKINFASDKQLVPGNKDHPMYPMKGLDRSDKDANGNVPKQKYFSEFTKYMLLRQAYYFNTHVSEILQKDQLKKHPAADFIYGRIPDDARAVKMRIVTDPIYRSPMTTGLYLAPGETVTVKIKGLDKGETVSLYTHHQDTMGYLGYNEEGKGFGKMEDYLNYWDDKIVNEAKAAESERREPDFTQFRYGLHGQWQWQNQKVPCMGTTFSFIGTGEEMLVEIGSMYGGPLYIKPTTDAVELEITGAVLTPHFVLGVTTVEEFETQLRKAPGLVATLDVENGQLIGPADAMRNADDIEKLAYFWHSVFAIDISLNGRDYNYNMAMCYDMHVPAGEAVALNSNFCAQPEYWFPICMNYETLTTKGNWGTFHELGHVQAKTHGVNWGFCDGDGEVWNNTLILLIYSMLCNMDSRVVGVEHGEYVHPFTAIERSQKITQEYKDKETGLMREIEDYSEINEGNGAHFDQLSMYATLLHSFGPQKFVDMFYTYKMDPAYCPNKRADFVYRIGVVDRVNILDWVNENYFANIEDGMFTASQLEFLHNLPDFVPVAYRWANGIDGNETARKYDVDGKHETVFDLSKGSFSSPEEVEVLSVTSALYGQADYDETAQKVTYTPPATPTEYDRFDIIVRTAGGRQVTLNVNMHLVYKGLFGEVYDLGEASAYNRPTVEKAKELIRGKEPAYTVSSSTAGVRFNNLDSTTGHNPVEYLHLQLKFRAPKSGTYTFYAQADDYAEIGFYRGTLDGTPAGAIKITRDTTSYTQFGGAEMRLEKNEVIFIDSHLVNWGGLGHMTIGVHLPDAPENEIVALPSEYLLSASVSDSDLAIVDEFKGWQPRFVDSIKNTTIDYQNSNLDWKILEAPVSEGGEAGQEVYRSNLVDGNEGTIYHSKYNGGTAQLPHIFVIDTQKDRTFNYFDIIRRTNGNDKLLVYQLYGCKDAQYAYAAQGYTDDDSGWTLLFDGASTNVNAARQRISFSRTEVRYFKLVILSNSGHTVIRELYAGVESKLSQTVKPANYMTQSTDLANDPADGFAENPANGKLTTKKGSVKFEFKFLGSGFALFADTDPSYGQASVTVDGKDMGIIDLSDKPLFNKQVFLYEGTETAEHTVVVLTVDDRPFNISFINVEYGTPVAADEYPAVDGDYGDQSLSRQFTREWKTLVKDYKDLTSIQFVRTAPQDYKDTYIRIDTYIRLYRSGSKIAFVYPGKILAPIECGSLFSGCEKLTELILDNFDTTYMRGATNMFYGCSSLESLDVSKFTTGNVLSFGRMFGDCTSLASMDLKSFELDENANLYRLFDNCTELESISLPEQTKNGNARRRASNASGITFELPYVYQDAETGEFFTEITLTEANAGHTLRLHRSHTFDGSKACVHNRVDPSCTEDGVVAYKTCLTCGCNFNFEDESTLYRTQADLVIPALGHDFFYYWPEDPNDYPTCTKGGKGGVYQCTHDGCGEIMSSVESTDPIGHSYMLDTSEGDGKGYTVEFLRRETIEKTEMVDEEGNSYYTQEEVVVKGVARVTWYLVCWGVSDYVLGTPCGHKTTVVIEIECDTHTDATCLEAETFFFDFSIGLEEFERAMLEQDTEDDFDDGFTASSFRTVTVNQMVEGEEAKDGRNALGHVVETVNAVPETCEGYGTTAGKKCAVCGLILEGITKIEPHGHKFETREAVEATCTTAGHGAGKVCVYCDEVGEGVDYIAPLGHSFTVDIEEELPTCNKIGHAAGKKCERCDAVEGCETLGVTEHTAVTVPGKAPTETESGLTDGTVCSECGEILEPQQEIPPLGPSGDLPAGDTPLPPPDDKPTVGVAVWVTVGVGAAVLVAAAAAITLVLLKKRRASK